LIPSRRIQTRPDETYGVAVSQKEEDVKAGGLAARVLTQVVDAAAAGVGSFKGAPAVAEEVLAASGGDAEAAIDHLIRIHVRLAAMNGAVTGLGGLLTLPITLPVGVSGFYLLAARLTCGVACLRCYDLDSEDVRSAVPLVMIGSAATEILRAQGITIGTKGLAAAISKVPGHMLIEINKAVGFRLITKAGSKGVVNLGKTIPLVGAPIGGTVDAASMRAVGRLAKKKFTPQPQQPPVPSTAP
jgi:hypothetical protein